jgi:hypothetical protein
MSTTEAVAGIKRICVPLRDKPFVMTSEDGTFMTASKRIAARLDRGSRT